MDKFLYTSLQVYRIYESNYSRKNVQAFVKYTWMKIEFVHKLKKFNGVAKLS